jgi:hypothetical protein
MAAAPALLASGPLSEVRFRIETLQGRRIGVAGHRQPFSPA